MNAEPKYDYSPYGGDPFEFTGEYYQYIYYEFKLGVSAYSEWANGKIYTGIVKAEPDQQPSQAVITDSLRESLPDLFEYVTHPETGQENRLLYSVIVELNDTHKWSRESIADWLDTLDLDLAFTPDSRRNT